MNEIRTIIIDDEQGALDSMEILLNEFPQIKILRKIRNPLDAFSVLVSEKPQLLFLDIQMPGISGIDFLEKIREFDPHVLVIFVTAFSDYALKAIKHHPFSYLLKPVVRIELKQTIEKVINTLNTEKAVESELVVVNSKTECLFIKPSDVLYFAANGSYTWIYLSDETSHLVSGNIGALLSKFPENIFVKLNRSLIVNKNYVYSVNRKQKCCVIKCNNKKLTFEVSTVFLREMNLLFNKTQFG